MKRMTSHILSVALLGCALTCNLFSNVAGAQTYQPVGTMPSPAVGAAVPGQAGQQPASPTQPQASGSQAGTPQTGVPGLQYRPGVQSLLIGRGDGVQIYVYNEPDMSQSVLVDDAGNIPLLMGGTVHIAGLTPEGAGLAVSRQLRDAQIMKDARVTVSILQFGTQAVSVLGEVVKPGTVTISTPRHVLDVISLAGGFTAISDRLRVTVQHGADPNNAEVVVLSNDPKIALQSNNVMVNPGDTVVVPRAPIVYVLGNVPKPGAYVMQYDSAMTVMQALSFAGGDLPDSKKGSIRVVRKTEGVSHEIPVPLTDIEKGKKEDMQLVADDVLYVPFSFPKHWLSGGASLALSGASTIIYAVR